MTDHPKSGRRRLTIVANRTGGQGKTLSSQLLAYAMARAGNPVVTVAADARSAGGTAATGVAGAASAPVDGLSPSSATEDTKSKLSKVIAGTIDLGIGSSVVEGGDAASILGYWDKLAEIAAHNDTLLDVGANVIDQIQTWAKTGQFSEALPHVDVDLVVPFIRQPQPIADAEAMVRELVSGDDGIKFRNVYLLQNHHGGVGVDDAYLHEFVNRLRLHVQTHAADRVGGIGLVSLPAMGSSQPSDRQSTLMPVFEKRHWLVGAVEQTRPFGTDKLAPLDVLIASLASDAPSEDNVIQVPGAASLAVEKCARDARDFEAHLATMSIMGRNREVRGFKGWLATTLDGFRRAGLIDGVPLANFSPSGAFVAYMPVAGKAGGAAGRAPAARRAAQVEAEAPSEAQQTYMSTEQV